MYFLILLSFSDNIILGEEFTLTSVIYLHNWDSKWDLYLLSFSYTNMILTPKIIFLHLRNHKIWSISRTELNEENPGEICTEVTLTISWPGSKCPRGAQAQFMFNPKRSMKAKSSSVGRDFLPLFSALSRLPFQPYIWFVNYKDVAN